MLTLYGQPYRLCDAVTRRAFLKIGGLALGGLSLADLLRAEAEAGVRGSHKAVIMVFLPGGPAHLDLYDLKPNAPAEVRGEFRPIKTNVPGIEICEHLPRLAGIMDKLVVIRSLVGATDDHASHLCLTGYGRQGPQPSGNWPNVGSVVSKLQGPADPTVPPFVALAARMLHPPYNDSGPGFLGLSHAGFLPDGECRANMALKTLSLERLQERRALLSSFDRLRRDLDATGTASAMDAFCRQAFEVLTSSKLRDALDLSREDPRVRERYGAGTAELIPAFNAAPRLTQQFLIARRLVEAGARCVTLAFGAWDWHDANFVGLKGQLPYLDQGVSALVEDLHARGLDKDVSVVVWGEMGRTPRINKNAGRDHWPAVSCALLAGGGMHAGQVIGSTNGTGEAVQDQPVHFLDVFATLYRNLGLDTSKTLTDLAGRPQFLVDHHQPIRELV